MGKYSKMHWTWRSSGESKPKRAFDTLEDAVRFAKINRLELQPYVCDVCGSWHLGHYRRK